MNDFGLGITSEIAPEPARGTDVNPRPLRCRCGHEQHPLACPVPACGCQQNRPGSS